MRAPSGLPPTPATNGPGAGKTHLATVLGIAGCHHGKTNGICERFHTTILQEFYQIAFRKKIYKTVEELQADLDAWLVKYNQERPHTGRYCYGKTPMETFENTLPLAKEKMLNDQHDATQLTTVLA